MEIKIKQSQLIGIIIHRIYSEISPTILHSRLPPPPPPSTMAHIIIPQYKNRIVYPCADGGGSLRVREEGVKGVSKVDSVSRHNGWERV